MGYGFVVSGLPIVVNGALMLISILVLGYYLYEAKKDLLKDKKLRFLLIGAAVFLMIMISAVLHELSHMAAAGYFDIKIVEMVLGGLFDYVRLETPLNQIGAIPEIVISLAGPAMNLLLFALGTGIDWTLKRKKYWQKNTGVVQHLKAFTLLNKYIVIFNLLPLFFVDGGKILHGIIWLLSGDPGFSQRGVDIATLMVIIVWLGKYHLKAKSAIIKKG